jgi:hypothetical protein
LQHWKNWFKRLTLNRWYSSHNQRDRRLLLKKGGSHRNATIVVDLRTKTIDNIWLQLRSGFVSWRAWAIRASYQQPESWSSSEFLFVMLSYYQNVGFFLEQESNIMQTCKLFWKTFFLCRASLKVSAKKIIVY